MQDGESAFRGVLLTEHWQFPRGNRPSSSVAIWQRKLAKKKWWLWEHRVQACSTANKIANILCALKHTFSPIPVRK